MLENQGLSEKIEMLNIFKVLTIILTLFLIYDLCTNTAPKIIRLKKPKFTPLGPYNITKYELDDVYNQLIDIKDFTFKINPQPCSEYTAGLLLIIIVSSNPINNEKRSVIRNTWGRSIDSTKIVFLVGESHNSTIAEKVYNESLIYGDIVLGNFVDAYRNMTYKHVMGLKWVALYCPMAKYVLKTDDDVVVNSHGLRHFLGSELSPWGAKNLIGCQVLKRAEVKRSHSKWTVTKDEFAEKVYPPYCPGWAVLYSQDVIPKLLASAQSAPYFWIDDVHITGVLATQLGIARTPLNDFILTGIPLKLLTTKTWVGYAKRFLLGPPDQSSDNMAKIWLAMRDF